MDEGSRPKETCRATLRSCLIYAEPICAPPDILPRLVRHIISAQDSGEDNASLQNVCSTGSGRRHMNDGRGGTAQPVTITPILDPCRASILGFPSNCLPIGFGGVWTEMVKFPVGSLDDLLAFPARLLRPVLAGGGAPRRRRATARGGLLSAPTPSSFWK